MELVNEKMVHSRKIQSSLMNCFSDCSRWVKLEIQFFFLFLFFFMKLVVKHSFRLTRQSTKELAIKEKVQLQVIVRL